MVVSRMTALIVETDSTRGLPQHRGVGHDTRLEHERQVPTHLGTAPAGLQVPPGRPAGLRATEAASNVSTRHPDECGGGPGFCWGRAEQRARGRRGWGRCVYPGSETPPSGARAGRNRQHHHRRSNPPTAHPSPAYQAETSPDTRRGGSSRAHHIDERLLRRCPLGSNRVVADPSRPTTVHRHGPRAPCPALQPLQLDELGLDRQNLFAG